MLGYQREILVGLAGFCSLVIMMCLDPIPQDPAYHQFADTRTVWGVPNFFNVTTNIFFLAVGLWGFVFCITHQMVGALWSWRIVFGAVTLVALGSGYYHWAPGNWTLVWDRLPMVIGFMGVFAAVLSENIDLKLETALLLPLCLIGVFSVACWHFMDDLRFYVWVQFFPLLGIIFVLLLFNGRYTHRFYLIIALGFYALAKAAEVCDKSIFAITQRQFSGHSLKHLLSALAVFILFLMLKRRSHREV